VALAVLLGAAACLPGYAFYQWHAAQVALREGRPDDARRALDFCLRVWPRSAAVHLLAARVDRVQGHFADAEAHLNRCKKLQGGATEATQLEFLLLRTQTGEVDEVAPALLDLAARDHPEKATILDALTRAYLHHFRYGPAYACLTRWIEAIPDSAQAYHWRGWVLERLNNYKLAMQDYERALELDPNLVAVRLRVAEMLLDDHKPLEAIPHLERLQSQEPGRADVMARLGQCRFLQGRAEEARRLLEAAVKELPNDISVLVHLGKLDLQEGRPAEAEAWLRRALAADPSATEVRYTLVNVLQVQGRRDEAAAELAAYERHKTLLERTNHLLRDEAERPGQPPDVVYELGADLLELGREREGLYWLDQALLRNPGHQPSHKALADYYEKKGDREKAAAHRSRLRPPDRKLARP
jgi:tetratricopeptide (TPR) repeat protein